MPRSIAKAVRLIITEKKEKKLKVSARMLGLTCDLVKEAVKGKFHVDILSYHSTFFFLLIFLRFI